MSDWPKLRAGIERLERRRARRPPDASRWDWYAEGCRCGLPAGECPEHPRARADQRPPAGEWSTWLVLAGRGFGKMLGMNTPIPTPTGWTTMGALRAGDEVFDESGRICRVTFTSVPEIPTSAYRLHFADGTHVDACADHQWVTWTHDDRKAFLRSPYDDPRRFPADWPVWRRKRRCGHFYLSQKTVEEGLRRHADGHSLRSIARRLGISRQALARHVAAGGFTGPVPRVYEDSAGPRIRTTREIVATLTHGRRGDRYHCIPNCGPLALPDADLPINAYVLGVWLGDGDSAGAVLTCSDAEIELLDILRAEGCPIGEQAGSRRGSVGKYGLGCTGRARDPKTGRMASNGSLHSRLRAAGLIGNKHVPAAYLRASASQRLALLQGLMDTDGGCERRGSYVSFTNCNRRLADAVAELAVSLGMKVRRDDRPAMLDNVARGTAYRVSFTPTVPVFRLTRKAAGLRFDGAQQLRRHHRMIVAAEPIERPGFMRCISVDSPHRMYLCGEGMIPTHNTRTGAEWVRHQVESGACRRIALVAPTSADVRDMMVEGESGILAISPPWFMPRYEPARRRLTWPNGARATTFSADEPDRLRVAPFEAAWCDEVAAWRYPAAFDNLLLGLRLGDDPRLCVTTTPRPVRLVVDLIDDPRTAITGGTTYDNRSHLAASFFERIVTRYEGTRLGRQELLAEVLEVSDGLWFRRFDAARHVALAAEYDDRIPVHLAIDCGVSRHTAAVWFQVRPSCHLSVASCQQDLSSTGNWQLTTGNSAVTVFGDFYAEGLYAEAAAGAIRARGEELPCRGRADTLRLDPALTARTGIGPTAYAEFERVFGPRSLARWPKHRVHDGLEQIEVLLDKGLLLIHPRCTGLTAAFQNYTRRLTGSGDRLDEPADPLHPHEDLMDALRGGVRDRFPEGRIEQPRLRHIHASRVV